MPDQRPHLGAVRPPTPAAGLPRTVAEHVAEVMTVISPLAPLELTLLDAHGCVLAEDVVGANPMPGFDNSAMDGYAVRSADLAGASEQEPVRLPVVGDVAAGALNPLTVQPGLCVRIMTGAPMPVGADAVVPVEWTDAGVAHVQVRRVPEPGAHVRRAGEDLRAGELVLPLGTVLNAAQVGLLAAAGRGSVLVRPRPRVVVVSTGSELVDAGTRTLPGQITDANSYALTAACTEAGAIAYRVGIVPDDPRRLLSTLEDHLIRADLVITSGGVSVGAYDVVKEVLGNLGTVGFHSVAMQPGKPQAFGVIGPDQVPLFGLPGNPVSALVSFEVFVRPAIRRMLAAEPYDRPQVVARLKGSVTASPYGKAQYLRADIGVEDGVYVVSQVGGTGSHLLSGMAAANALIVVPPEVTQVGDGEAVTVMLLERRR